MCPLLIVPDPLAIPPLLLLANHNISLILTKASKHLEQFLDWKCGLVMSRRRVVLGPVLLLRPGPV